MDIDNEWELFLNGENTSFSHNTQKLLHIAPKSSDIYISTKTKIAYLNTTIPLNDVFWKIPVKHYYSPCECVIKKQMKFNTAN